MLNASFVIIKLNTNLSVKSWFVIHITTIHCWVFQLNQELFDLLAPVNIVFKIQEIFSIKMRMTTAEYAA